MRRFMLFHFFTICCSLLICNPATADSLTDSIQSGKASLNIRYRIETVEQNNALLDATASTVRTRFGYTTGDFHSFSIHFDFEDVHSLIQDDYFAVVSGDPTYSTIADPEGTELNQAYLNYNLENTKLRLGRQRIILDNARFVGNVGWRQNEQTYDGLSFTNTRLSNTTITYAHISNVNRIFFNDLDMRSDLLNITYQGFARSKLTFYGYLLEYVAAPSLSHKTIGARYSTKKNHVLLALEYASQSEYESGSNRDTRYMLLETGYLFSDKTSAKLGLETLGSDAGVSFLTPLATLHAFNGWADQFLNTPANGLKDTHISFNTKLNKIKFAAIYHSFKADVGGSSYGKELDLVANMRFKKNLSGGLKLARYDANSHLVDTNKLWLWLQYNM